MDIGKAFGFVFEDEKWVSKVLLGGLFFLIPIVNFAVIGYMLKVAQNVAQGNPRPLPEWGGGEFGNHFMRGLHGIVIQIVYQLPTKPARMTTSSNISQAPRLPRALAMISLNLNASLSVFVTT